MAAHLGFNLNGGGQPMCLYQLHINYCTTLQIYGVIGGCLSYLNMELVLGRVPFLTSAQSIWIISIIPDKVLSFYNPILQQIVFIKIKSLTQFQFLTSSFIHNGLILHVLMKHTDSIWINTVGFASDCCESNLKSLIYISILLIFFDHSFSY